MIPFVIFIKLLLVMFHLYIEPQTELLKRLAELQFIGKRRHRGMNHT